MWWMLSFFAQSAEKGSWPEVLCATEDGLKSEALYGPTKRMETVGAVGECKLAPHPLPHRVLLNFGRFQKNKQVTFGL